MNVHQSAVPVLIVLAPLLTSFMLPVLGWWYRPAAVVKLPIAGGKSQQPGQQHECHASQGANILTL